jgi:hypothetical protein
MSCRLKNVEAVRERRREEGGRQGGGSEDRFGRHGPRSIYRSPGLGTEHNDDDDTVLYQLHRPSKDRHSAPGCCRATGNQKTIRPCHVCVGVVRTLLTLSRCTPHRYRYAVCSASRHRCTSGPGCERSAVLFRTSATGKSRVLRLPPL